MSINIDKVRADTSACENLIHLNNAGASLPPKAVTEAMVAQLRRDETLGGYETQFGNAQEELQETYRAISELIGGQVEEIALTDGATRAFQSALYSMDWKSGDRIVTSEAEYPSNVYAYTYLQRRFGVETTYVGDDEAGQVDLGALESAIDSRTQLITATHIPTFGGLINPAREIGKIANKAGVRFLLDACQSVGHLHLDVTELGCNMLTAAGRKYLRGPRGTGFLWVDEKTLPTLRPPFVDNFSALWKTTDSFELRNDARRFELFERSPALHLGLGAAAKYALNVGTRAIEERVLSLGADLRNMLSKVPRVTVQDKGAALSGIVTFTVDGAKAEDVAAYLKTQSINTAVSLASYAMRSFPKRGLDAVVRASVHYYNTNAELERLCEAVENLR